MSHESHLTTLPSIPDWSGCKPLQNRKRGVGWASQPETDSWKPGRADFCVFDFGGGCGDERGVWGGELGRAGCVWSGSACSVDGQWPHPLGPELPLGCEDSVGALCSLALKKTQPQSSHPLFSPLPFQAEELLFHLWNGKPTERLGFPSERGSFTSLEGWLPVSGVDGMVALLDKSPKITKRQAGRQPQDDRAREP